MVGSVIFSSVEYYYSEFASTGSLDRETAKEIAQIYFVSDGIIYNYASDGDIRIALCVYDDFANGSVRVGMTSTIKIKLDFWLTSVESKSSILEMEREVDDIVVKNTRYTDAGVHHQSSAGTLLEGTAVCASYADVFEMHL